MSTTSHEIHGASRSRRQDLGDRLACAALVVAVLAALALAIPFIAAMPWPR